FELRFRQNIPRNARCFERLSGFVALQHLSCGAEQWLPARLLLQRHIKSSDPTWRLAHLDCSRILEAFMLLSVPQMNAAGWKREPAAGGSPAHEAIRNKAAPMASKLIACPSFDAPKARCVESRARPRAR